jgi:hypothetical protein
LSMKNRQVRTSLTFPKLPEFEKWARMVWNAYIKLVASSLPVMSVAGFNAL